MSPPSTSAPRTAMRWILALFYAVAGYGHLAAPESFLSITPGWVPFAPWVIFVTGLLEIAGAVALVTNPLRRAAGIGLALYALCVWPANFKHAFEAIDIAGMPSSWWYHGPRLVFQPIIIWLTLFSAGVIDWPVNRMGRER